MQKNRKVCAYVRAVAPIDGMKELEKQLEAINCYCVENGLTVSYVYKEISSGSVSVLKRPAGDKMFDACRAGMFDTIIVSNIDRIGRNFYVIDEFLMIADKMGINIISVAKNGNVTCFDDDTLRIFKEQIKSTTEVRE